MVGDPSALDVVTAPHSNACIIRFYVRSGNKRRICSHVHKRMGVVKTSVGRGLTVFLDVPFKHLYRSRMRPEKLKKESAVAGQINSAKKMSNWYIKFS